MRFGANVAFPYAEKPVKEVVVEVPVVIEEAVVAPLEETPVADEAPVEGTWKTKRKKLPIAVKELPLPEQE